MLVNVVQWRVETGLFDALYDVKYTIKFLRSNLSSSIKKKKFTLVLLFISADIGFNPGLNETNSSCKFCVCHWNLNSLAAHNFKRKDYLRRTVQSINLA